MTDVLSSKACTPCQGGIPPLTPVEANHYLAQTQDWKLLQELLSEAAGKPVAGRQRDEVLASQLPEAGLCGWGSTEDAEFRRRSGGSRL